MNSQRYTPDPPWTEDIMNAIDFGGDSFDPTPYDEAHEPGYAARVIECYRRTREVRRFF